MQDVGIRCRPELLEPEHEIIFITLKVIVICQVAPGCQVAVEVWLVQHDAELCTIGSFAAEVVRKLALGELNALALDLTQKGSQAVGPLVEV